MTTEEIFVRFPSFYWLAHPACFPDLREDPDEADGREPRHSDKDQINWLAVGQKAQVVLFVRFMVSGGALGFGAVRLGVLLGTAVGGFGWWVLLAAFFVSSVIGLVMAVGYMAV